MGFLFSITACILMLALAGCGGESTGTTATDTGTTTETGAGGTGGTTSTGTGTMTPSGPKKLVVFTRTAGFVHSSIPVARAALAERAAAEGWELVDTDDAAFF